jgi:hypothetical protein
MGAAKRRRALLGDAYGQPPAWAWHYTLGRKIPLILHEGLIRDAWTHANAHRHPFPQYSIWFTTSEMVDPTSTPAYTFREGYGRDWEQFKAGAGGHWRIGIHATHKLLHTYEEVQHTHPFFRHLPRAGEDRRKWRVSLEDVPLDGCRIEEMVDGVWVPRTIETLSHSHDGPGYGHPSGLVLQVMA